MSFVIEVFPILGEHDFERLSYIAFFGHWRTAARLGRELARARILPSKRVPPSVVTMNSRVLLQNVSSGETREVTLVYPFNANPAEGKISVDSPIGSSLIGASVNQVVSCELDGGRLSYYRILSLLYQPESAGHIS